MLSAHHARNVTAPNSDAIELSPSMPIDTPVRAGGATYIPRCHLLIASAMCFAVAALIWSLLA